MLADQPFLDVLWTGFLLFLWVGWVFLVVLVLMDVLRRHDISGWSKALWTVAIVVVPWLGVLVYLISQGDGMGQRRLEAMEHAQQRAIDRSQSPAGGNGGGVAAEIERAKALLDAGTITAAEFESLKQRALA